MHLLTPHNKGMDTSRSLRKFFAGLTLLPLLSSAQAMGLSQAESAKQSTVNKPQGSSLTGIWQGTLTGARPERVLLKVTAGNKSALIAIFYVLDRAPRPLAANEFLIDGRDFDLAIGAINARFEGKLNESKLSVTGTWTQGGVAQTLTLTHVSDANAWQMPEAPPPRRVVTNGLTTTYEVATLKPASPYATGSGMRVSGRRLEALNMSLSGLIEFSYELHKSQIENTPDWDSKDKFDATMLYPGDTYPNDVECKAMVRQLLADRFELRFHRANKQLNAYSLEVAKSGPKLAKSEGDPNGLPGLHFSAPGVFGAQNASMADFANELQRTVMSRPVIDNTGLSGRFDFGLEWTPDELQFGGRSVDANVNSNKPDLSKALEEQLGLRLQSTRMSVATFSIDRLNRPTDE